MCLSQEELSGLETLVEEVAHNQVPMAAVHIWKLIWKPDLYILAVPLEAAIVCMLMEEKP